MMDARRSPPREGTRGGLELFKWEDVKSQGFKDRECYLGQSLKVGMTTHGGNFYKHDWWTKGQTLEKTELAEELEVTRLYEDELMKEALGLKPQRLLTQKANLSVKQKKLLLETSEKPVNQEISSIESKSKHMRHEKKKKKRKKEIKRSKRSSSHRRPLPSSGKDHRSCRISRVSSSCNSPRINRHSGHHSHSNKYRKDYS
ncbi:hypothetical protein IE077_002744 [Cardiosporidium cionae]|uniref:Multiple myeloma tumor-associated protein 2-like N-terminal domain-containing protein n=1 Tax=Cardiosporidium cionae TaxID=476202 RepID=A0ABQ7JFG6_9APIC|nr:hypothetical protein IE077_002744 [Cardiosporidium cionae]|eukprot:KAF8822755.1 hypothetical protein IE077_002744 [Cardiosporidium cionae]